MKVRSFCPGHITGFFQIVEHGDPLRSGSRGAGMCVDLGARCELAAGPGSGKVSVRLDRSFEDAPVTVDAVKGLPGSNGMDFEVAIENELPIGQGFGMSAAGAVAASLAASVTLGLGREEAIKSAHLAELKNRTGLGDVAALYRGGVTFRRKEGIPPYGQIDRIEGDPPLVLCVVGRPFSTAIALSDRSIREKVNAAGSECVEHLAESPDLDALMKLSRSFMKRTGLAETKVEVAVAAAEEVGGRASMVMLGGSLFALGDPEKLADVLQHHGRIYRTRVDLLGPRVISKEI
jgi:pantoate kinase